ncbi:MAG TPA: hypothetical protein VEK07_18305 [Polyangiaceae bacterium]|nr:hypothetical protein [Polyangiaceae bacterium]
MRPLTFIGSEACGRWANRACWTVAMALLALHFVVVLSNAVNVPFWDDWTALFPGGLDDRLNFTWLVGFHAAHRNIPTNLSIWLLYQIGHWNISTHIALNFIVYIAMVVVFLGFLERTYAVPMGVAAILAASAIADESHLHAFNGCWTIFLFAFFASVELALRTDRWAWAAPFCATVSCYSMFGGMVVSSFFIPLSLLLAQARPSLRRRHIAQAVIMLAFLALWFVGYRADATTMTYPWQWRFWDHFANLVALGFGYSRVDDAPGFAYLALIVVLGASYAVEGLRSGDEEGRARTWALLVLLLGLLSSLATISLGRAWAGAGGAKSGRYGEVALFLVPITWVLFGRALRRIRQPSWAHALTAVAAALILLMPARANFEYGRIYGAQRERRLAGLRCLHEHYYRGGGPYCADIYNDPKTALLLLQRARALRLSFVAEHSPL